MKPDNTPADDALRAAVERVTMMAEGHERTARARDEMAALFDADDPIRALHQHVAKDARQQATDLRLILSALTAPPDTRQSGFVTEEMVERGARAMCSSKGYPPDEIFHAQGETPMRMWQFFKEDARAALTAALGVKNG